MNYKLFCVALLTAVGLAAQTKDDVVFRAMRDELQRSMKKLQLEQMQRPYFISYHVFEADDKDASGFLGSLINASESRSRILTVDVRVGDYSLDNSNFLSFSFGNGVVFTGYQELPLDDNYDELRRQLWLATDGAYKKALEDFSHKRAALENRHRTEDIPDFSKQPPTSTEDIQPRAEASIEDLRNMARRLSLLFREAPTLQTSRVNVDAKNVIERFVTSEGSFYTRRTGMVTLHATATTQAPDGMPLNSAFTFYRHSLHDLPEESQIATRIKGIIQNLNDLQAAPVSKEYNGPVLFEGQAAAEMVRRFAGHLTAQPEMVSDNQQIMQQVMRGQQQESSLLNKRGARVLPEFLSLVDDPTANEHDGQLLWGSYKVDEEGTPAQQKVVVENGILKTLLTSRAPVRGILQSTGNLRGAGVAPSNLFLNASKSVSPDELKKQLLDMVKSRSLEYGILVRRLSNRDANLAYRIYPDGHEELIRYAIFASAGPASFKDIVAVSNTPTVHTEPFAPVQRGLMPSFANSFGVPTLVSYVAPSLLFEDLTVEQPTGDVPKPPLITNPLATK